MSTYTSGELAKLCEVSVRTVQFYDSKGLLKPSEISENGRRLYTDNEVEKLKLICMFKALSLSLSSIKEIFESKNTTERLLDILEEQTKHIDLEINEKLHQKKMLKTAVENISLSKTVSIKSIKDIEMLIKGKTYFRKLIVYMLSFAVVAEVFEILTFILWVSKGVYWPFVGAFSLSLLISIAFAKKYYKTTEYICPNCNNRFRPKFKEFLFSYHTPKKRKLKCPKCSKKTLCFETYSYYNKN